ncbi:hypothetical protein J1N35_037446, partial [Gossypium stocksii]
IGKGDFVRYCHMILLSANHDVQSSGLTNGTLRCLSIKVRTVKGGMNRGIGKKEN